MNYVQIKANYDRGLWNVAMVAKAVEKGVLTAYEYQQITGMVYGSPINVKHS